MFRIDDPTAATALPAPEAAGTEGYFTEGNPVAGTPATLVRGSFLNMIQEELRAIVVAGGLVPSKTTYNQVLAAIRALGKQSVQLADTGAVNAYAAANPTPLVAGTWVNGVVQQVTIAHTNTGASTYSPDGLTAIPIYGLALQALQGNELFLGGTAILMKATIAGINSGNPICVLMECFGGAQQVAPATQSQHAAQLAQLGNQQTSTTLGIGATTTLTIGQVGSLIVFQGGTLNLPSLASCRVGSAFPILATASGSVVCNGTDKLQFDGIVGHSVSSLPVIGTGFTLINGGTAWFYFCGTAAFKYSAEFAAVLATPGYQKNPSGLIEQWGNATSGASGVIAVTFPIAFPTAALGIEVSMVGAGAAGDYGAISGTPTTTGVTLYGLFNGAGATAVPLTYRVWGY